jgi:predicted cupin superfamily sugar epimerase
MKDSNYYIDRLYLDPHPEGGYFREVYRSQNMIRKDALPYGFEGERVCSTSIYYLLEKDDFSAFHRIKSDEIWHHYDGGSVKLYVLVPDGNLIEYKLGKRIENGEKPQVTVPANCWFAAVPDEDCSFVLAGCTVSPGFDFADFEMALPDHLGNEYPKHKDFIQKYCK